jgi:mono/diheme cytochrome c family protein
VRRTQLTHILIGAAIALAVVVPLAAFAYVKSGIYNVGASNPHTKFTEWLTHETMIHSVRSHAKSIVAPASAGAAQVRRGFCEYETHCVACHGASAVARERWVSGMEPAPPYLLDATQRFRPRELFWIAKNGIKMTGMPSWRNSMSDAELWDVVAFLEARTDSQTYLQWRSAGFCPQVSGEPSPGPLSIPPRAPARPTGATGG